MKPIWNGDKLTVELHKPDILKLKQARIVGLSLVAMHQPGGQALADSVTEILKDGVVKGHWVELEDESEPTSEP